MCGTCFAEPDTILVFTFNPIHRLRALYAQSSGRTLAPPRLTVAAGTELAGASSSSPVMIAHSKKELYKRHCPLVASLKIAYITVGEQITAEQLIEKCIVMMISRHDHEHRHHIRVK